MFTYELERINITDYFDQFLLSLHQRYNTPKRVKRRHEAEHVRDWLNNTDKTKFKSVTDIGSKVPYWEEQEVDFIPSNLGDGRGFIYYFTCNNCGRRAKYLYRNSMVEEPRCRNCLRLKYKPS